MGQNVSKKEIDEIFINKCADIYIDNYINNIKEINNNKIVTYFDLLVKITNNFKHFFVCMSKESTHKDPNPIIFCRWEHSVEHGKLLSRMCGINLSLLDVTSDGDHKYIVIMKMNSSHLHNSFFYDRKYYLLSYENIDILKYFFPTFDQLFYNIKYYLSLHDNVDSLKEVFSPPKPSKQTCNDLDIKKNYWKNNWDWGYVESINISCEIDKMTLNIFITKILSLIENYKNELNDKLSNKLRSDRNNLQYKIDTINCEIKKIDKLIEQNSTDLYLEKLKTNLLTDLQDMNKNINKITDELNTQYKKKQIKINILKNLAESLSTTNDKTNKVESKSIKYSNYDQLCMSDFIVNLFNFIYNNNKVINITKFETIYDLLILLDRMNPINERLLDNNFNETFSNNLRIKIGENKIYLITNREKIIWHKNSEHILRQLNLTYFSGTYVCHMKIDKKVLNKIINYAYNEIKKHESILLNYEKEIEFYKEKSEYSSELNFLEKSLESYKEKMENFIMNVKHLDKIISID